MLRLLFFLFTIAGVRPMPDEALVQQQWENFKLEHGKFYDSETEEQYRRSIYMDNLHTINEHNKLFEHNLTSYQMGMNHMGDLSGEEFLRLYSSNILELEDPENSTISEPRNENDFYISAPSISLEEVESLPRSINWKTRGFVTRVKNQGNCDSCWSFAATGALEAQWRLHRSHELVELSEQNLIDCSRRYGNRGCKGGEAAWSFRYIRNNGGIATERSYPYTARNGPCRYSSNNRGATVSRVVRIPIGEKQLQSKVATVGPIATAIEMRPSFQLYKGGVYNDPKCRRRRRNLNHAILVVGYDSEGGKDYWLVKNTFGSGWGENGYIRMSRNRKNQCGIGSWGSYPVV